MTSLRMTVATVDLDEAYRERLASGFPEHEFLHLRSDSNGVGIEQGSAAEVLLYWGINKAAYPALQRLMPSLAWIHVPWVGTDWLVTERVRSGELQLTNSPGAASQPVAEYVLAVMLADLKQLHAQRANQLARHWSKDATREAGGRRLLIVGLGSIGRRCLQMAAMLDMRVRAVTRTPAPVPGCEAVLPMARLHDELGQADYVLVTLPATADTRDMFSRDAFAAMRRDACFINIGRGEVVDEGALIAALREGLLRCAYLDVVRQEPLPHDSPMWLARGLYLTTHIASSTPERFDRSFALFTDNLRRRTAGQPLKHCVAVR